MQNIMNSGPDEPC